MISATETTLPQASSTVKNCPRCKSPLLPGHNIALWSDGPKAIRNGAEAEQWVHADCKATAIKKIAVDLTSELAELINSIDFDKADEQIRELINTELDKFSEQISDVVSCAAGSISEHCEKQSMQIARQIAKETVENLAPRRVEIVRPDSTVHQISGHTHPAFEKVLKLASLRKNILLPGPAGCGKSHLASQVAEALGLPFAAISCSAGMSEGQITGRLLPTGTGGQFVYVESEFVRCYENGGVFLLDEIDAADPNVLIVINSAIANGILPLPNRPESPRAKRHADFVLIAAANTFGRGADRLYVGRNELDEATLDRFRIGTVCMDYDENLEKVLCPNDSLRKTLQGHRQRCNSAKLERIVSTRFLRDAFEMSEAGWSQSEIEDQLFSGWSEDEIRKVRK